MGFEGIYIRGGDTAVILGRQKTGCFKRGHSFIQFVSRDLPWYGEFPYKDYKSWLFGVRLGALDINDDRVRCKLQLGPFTPIRGCAMGPLCLVPGLECRHFVLSMRNTVKGRLSVGDREIHFENRHGYVEGDRGSGFPKKYFWAQCGEFTDPNLDEKLSIMASVAVIPYLGVKHTGTLCIINFCGKEFRLASYRGAKVKTFEKNRIVVTQGRGKKRLTLEVEGQNPGTQIPVKAPIKGQMSRSINESLAAEMRFKLTRGADLVFDCGTKNGAYETGGLGE